MLPKTLTSRLINILGADYDAVIGSISKIRNGSLRINTLKSTESELLGEFDTKGIIVESYADGIFRFDRDQEYAIKGTRAFYDGKIYLQSIASMLPVLVLKPQSGESVLDVCAAPGSKTTQMAMMMNNRGKIVALEQNQIRYDKLIYNCRLQGATLVEGVKMDALRYLRESKLETRHSDRAVPTSHESWITNFDRILLDAPCSAEGRIQLQNEKSYGFWSIENIRKKAELQYELLLGAFNHLKKGGTLVYSTCTLAPEENEGVISRFLAEQSDAKLQDINIGFSEKSWWRQGISEFEGVKYHPDIQKTVRILPSDETEGFFVAKIEKI